MEKKLREEGNGKRGWGERWREKNRERGRDGVEILLYFPTIIMLEISACVDTQKKQQMQQNSIDLE